MAKGIVFNTGRFQWNIDQNVGPGCPNIQEDVHLVQLGYVCMATNTKNPQPAEDKAIYEAVVVGAAYNGAANDPLTLAIKRHQQKRGGTQDGHVSSIKSTAGTYDGAHTWMLSALNNNILDALGTAWPRIGRHAKATAALKELEKRAFE